MRVGWTLVTIVAVALLVGCGSDSLAKEAARAAVSQSPGTVVKPYKCEQRSKSETSVSYMCSGEITRDGSIVPTPVAFLVVCDRKEKRCVH